MRVTELTDDDRKWVKERTELLFGGEFVVSRDEVHDPHELPGYIACEGPERVGLVTYCLQGDECELVSIDSLCQFMGVGTALLERVEDAARSAGCRKIWAITTNDNLDAQRFFQKRGFVITHFRIGGMTKIRLLKPNIPRIGYYGIPIRDEIEFAKPLTPLAATLDRGEGERRPESTSPKGIPDSTSSFFSPGRFIEATASRRRSQD